MDEARNQEKAFEITLQSVEYEPQIMNRNGERISTRNWYLVVFMLAHWRGEPEQRNEFRVWVDGEQTPIEHVVRVAMHQLHQDLALLERSVRTWAAEKAPVSAEPSSTTG